MKRTLSEDAWLASVGKYRGVAIRILDVFEKVLESKGISIPDEDRTGDESEACLYGITYGTLEDEVSDLLGQYYGKDATSDSMNQENDPMKVANRVIRSITTEDGLTYKDIRTFETDGFFGIWDTSESAFVLLPKTNFQYHHITLNRCSTLAELDDEVFKACLEHITSVSRSSAYAISGKYK